MHPDHHVSVARSLYSAPTAYLGRTLRVRVDRTVVRMYLGQQLVKTHARVAPGKRSTDPGYAGYAAWHTRVAGRGGGFFL
jgi:hypothetical protein